MGETRNDDIDVELLDGTPTVFWWKRFAYVIEGTPALFYRRASPWWTERAVTPMTRIDVEHWRVAAKLDGEEGEAQLYDLRHDDPGWTLVYAW